MVNHFNAILVTVASHRMPSSRRYKQLQHEQSAKRIRMMCVTKLSLRFRLLFDVNRHSAQFQKCSSPKIQIQIQIQVTQMHTNPQKK